MRVYLLQRKGQVSKEKEAQGKQSKSSLYLVYHYGPKVKREYEFLGLYLYQKPKTQLQKDHNKETLHLAESIRSKRHLEAQSSKYGFRTSSMNKASFFEFFKKQAQIRREQSDQNYEKWMSVYKIMLRYNNDRDLTMEEANEDFLEGFKEFLLSDKASTRSPGKKLNKNSASAYFNIVKTALNEAYRAKLIKENPARRVKCINNEETHRAYLTFEELQKLANQDCKEPLLKKAFIFSALTGLRWSDVSTITWGQIKLNENEGWMLTYTQKKTRKAEILPIPEQAVKLLGKQGGADEVIFAGLSYSARNNTILREWVHDAGISKHISFHCSRHTYSVLQLSMNTDIYTVSKLLGHKNLRTTEIYAKVIDKKKIEAANKIPELIF